MSEHVRGPDRRWVWQAILLASALGGLLLGVIFGVMVTLPLAAHVYHDPWPVLLGAFVGLILGFLLGLIVGVVALTTRGVALRIRKSPAAEAAGVASGTLLGTTLLYVVYLGHSDLNPAASAALFIALPSIAMGVVAFLLGRLSPP